MYHAYDARVARVGGETGAGRGQGRDKETTLNFGPQSKTTTGYEMRVRGSEKEKGIEREEEETTEDDDRSRDCCS